jgi:hypothetical protein
MTEAQRETAAEIEARTIARVTAEIVDGREDARRDARKDAREARRLLDSLPTPPIDPARRAQSLAAVRDAARKGGRG